VIELEEILDEMVLKTKALAGSELRSYFKTPQLVRKLTATSCQDSFLAQFTKNCI